MAHSVAASSRRTASRATAFFLPARAPPATPNQHVRLEDADTSQLPALWLLLFAQRTRWGRGGARTLRARQCRGPAPVPCDRSSALSASGQQRKSEGVCTVCEPCAPQGKAENKTDLTNLHLGHAAKGRERAASHRGNAANNIEKAVALWKRNNRQRKSCCAAETQQKAEKELLLHSPSAERAQCLASARAPTVSIAPASPGRWRACTFSHSIKHISVALAHAKTHTRCVGLIDAGAGGARGGKAAGAGPAPGPGRGGGGMVDIN